MSELKRYIWHAKHITHVARPYISVSEREDPAGEWVRFRDADTRIRELKARIAELEERLQAYHDQDAECDK